jgi:hypothetical protein
MAFRTRFLTALPLLAILGLSTALTPAVARENYALIVAASEYENYDQKLWLKGPPNDALLARAFLTSEDAPSAFKPENVRILMTGEGETTPTRAAILEALADLAAKAAPGDFVFLQFSGHGSAQASQGGMEEADGKDEVFLPADAGQPVVEDGRGFYPDALTDNDIGAALTAIRAKGAFVWAIFDFCHSGTVTRALEEEGLMDRRLDMVTDFGIDPADLEDAAGSEDEETNRGRVAALDEAVYEAPSSDVPAGGLVAFFAAQATEPTPEKRYPTVLPDGSTQPVAFGVFTRALYTALASNPAMTYRELAQSILQDYAGQNRVRPTPMFEGDLDAPVFGTDTTARQRQWAMKVDARAAEITIPAGELHGLTPGSRLLVLPSPAATADEALGVLEVVKTGTLSSTLTPIADEAGATIDIAAIPNGGYARLDARNYAFRLRVARPDPAHGSDPELVAAINSTLDAILADPERPLELEIVEAGEEAALRLSLLSGTEVAELTRSTEPVPQDFAMEPTRLWLLQDTADISLSTNERPFNLVVSPDGPDPVFQQELTRHLATIYRAMGLSRLGAANTYKPGQIELGFSVQRAGDRTVAPIGDDLAPELYEGDQVHLSFANQSGKPVTLNLLYVASNNAIKLLCNAHLENRASLFEPILILDDSDQGPEKLIAVVTETDEDLAYLTQAGLPEATRGDDVGLGALLQQLGHAETTRGGTLAKKTGAAEPRGAVLTTTLLTNALDGDVASEDPFALEAADPQTSVCVSYDPEDPNDPRNQ